MKLIGGYENTFYNGEDLQLTPFLFLVNPGTKIVKIYGLGFCWLHQAV